MKQLRKVFAAMMLLLINTHSYSISTTCFIPLSSKTNDSLSIKTMIKEIEKIENERTIALLKKNYAYLEQLMSNDCVHIESNGTVRTTAEFIRSFKNGDFIFKEFEITENNIRIYGNTAVVTGKYNNVIISNGKENPRKFALHTRVYVRQENTWKLVSHQATEIKK